MDTPTAGQLVKVSAGGPVLDGIVFDAPSSAKIVVAVVDPGRGPVFRTYAPSDLAQRTEAGPDDRALRLLVRRTPPPAGGSGRGGPGAQRGRSGHTRATTHRTTGR
ncbi:MAG: hypothetical protein ACR2KV_17320 [Solirubrobacteraceae bacterium]